MYSEDIIVILRKRNGLSPEDTSKDEIFNKMSPSRVFSEVLIWNGLLGGWDSQIKDWVKDIYKIDLDVRSDSMMKRKTGSM